MKQFFQLCIASFLLMHCSGSSGPTRSPIVKPIAIEILSETIMTGGNLTRLGYVLDQHAQTISVFETNDDKVIDARNGDDWDRTPLPAGEKPVALAVDEGVSPHRIFVADAGQNIVWGYEIASASFDSIDSISWNVLDLGTVDVSSVSRPLFFNDGSASQVTMQNLTSQTTAGGIQSWIVRHEKATYFSVTGTTSGELASFASIGNGYGSSELSFLMQEGARDVSGQDRFHFSSMRSKPLQLSNAPADLLIQDRVMYILTQGGNELVLFNLDTLSVDAAKSLTLTNPNRMSFGGGKIFMTDAQTNNIEVYDIAADSLSLLTVAGRPDSKFSFARFFNDKLYVLSDLSDEIIRCDAVTGVLEAFTDVTDQPNDFTVFEQSGVNLALLPLASGEVELFDIQSFSRIDTEKDIDADFDNPEFFDVGEVSSPELIAVGTFEGVTKTEQWQLVYEGSLVDVSSLNATVTSSVVTMANPLFDLPSTTLQVGDYLQVGQEFIEVVSIDSGTTMTLSSQPQAQGAQLITAFAKESYVVIGSKSGQQVARVFKDQNYQSDGGEIALFVRSSLDQPVTRGDLFTFSTLDGVQPINKLASSPRSLATRAVVIQKTTQTDPTGYLLYQGSGAIGRISLENQEVNRVFR